MSRPPKLSDKNDWAIRERSGVKQYTQAGRDQTSLMEKASIFIKLDQEIIAVTEEEQLEMKIDQSDRIQLESTLALISIEESLETITTPTEGLSGHHLVEERHSPSPGPRDEVYLATLPTSVSISVSLANSITTSSVIATPMLDSSPYSATASSGSSTHLTSPGPTGLLPPSVALPLTTRLSWPSIMFTSASGLSGTTLGSSPRSFGLTSLLSSASFVLSGIPSSVSPLSSGMSSFTS